MDPVAQKLFEGLLDRTRNADLPRRGNLKKRLEKLGFPVFAQIASAPYAVLAALDRLWTQSVVPGYHVMYGRNRNVRMNSDLGGRPRINQRVPDHKPSALLSAGRLPQPY